MWWGSDGGRVGPGRVDASDRDQWQAQVAHFAQQAVQRGLVGHRAMDDGGAVAFVREAQSVKPGGPAGRRCPLRRISYCRARGDRQSMRVFPPCCSFRLRCAVIV